MEIQINGAVIVVEVGELEKAKDLVCVCGHKLYTHASYVQFFYPDQNHHTMYQSQCTACKSDVKKNTFDCPKFRISNEH